MGKLKFDSEAWRRVSLQLNESIQEEIAILEKALKGFQGVEKKNYPERVRVNRDGKGISYYLINKKNEVHGQYARKADIEKVTAIIQEDYNKKTEKEIERELYFLRILAKNITYIEQQKLLSKMHPGRRLLLKVLCKEDEKLIETWKNQKYEKLKWNEEQKKYHTTNGVEVRSKSEKIIGDELEKRNIPYRYEAKTVIGKKVYYPDFTILNMKTMEEIYWEHFGLMEDEEYRVKAYEKIEAYSQAGFINGRFIATFEEKDRSINQKAVERLIDKYFNNSP